MKPDAVTSLAEALEALLEGRTAAPESLAEASAGDAREARLVDVARRFLASWREAQAYAEELARGELDPARRPRDNQLAASLKQLHGMLVHVAWQASRVAEGDLAQRIDFGGAFGEAFNRMVDALSHSRVCLDESIASLKESREELRRLAILDPLTGVYNRRYFLDRGHEEVRRAQRYARPLSVAMLDLDHFKRVNDTFGHSAGDVVLVEVSRRIQAGLRVNDLLGRLGGEEFALILSEAAADTAFMVAERVRVAVSRTPITAAEESLSITLSVGVASACCEDYDIEDLLARADRALYQAKSEGRNRTVRG